MSFCYICWVMNFFQNVKKPSSTSSAVYSNLSPSPFPPAPNTSAPTDYSLSPSSRPPSNRTPFKSNAESYEKRIESLRPKSPMFFSGVKTTSTLPPLSIPSSSSTDAFLYAPLYSVPEKLVFVFYWLSYKQFNVLNEVYCRASSKGSNTKKLEYI